MSGKKSLLVLAPHRLEVGFKLGGARTETVADAVSLNAAIGYAIEKGEAGIIAVPEIMRKFISEKNLATTKKKAFPVLAFYPVLSKGGE